MQFSIVTMDKKIKKKRAPVKAILGVGLLLAFAGFFGYQIMYVDTRPTVFAKEDELDFATVIQGDFQEFINITGAIVPGDTLYLDSLEGGQVKSILVEAGDIVKKGDVILTLENTDLEMDKLLKEARIIEKKYELESAYIRCEKKRHGIEEALLDLNFKLIMLEKDYKRNRTLHQAKYISADSFEEIEDSYNYWKEKRAMLLTSRKIEERLMGKDVKQLEAGLNLLKTDYRKISKRLEDLTLVSPATGLLTSLDASVGETKNKGSRVGQIDLTDNVKVSAQIDEYYLDRVMVGNSGAFTIFDTGANKDMEYEIRLASISPEVRDNLFEAEFIFSGKHPEKIRLGQSFTVRLALGNTYNAMLLKKGPFIQKTGGSWVYVLDDSQKRAMKRKIRIGKNNPDYFEILEGLNLNEKVIISTYEDYENMKEILLN